MKNKNENRISEGIGGGLYTAVALFGGYIVNTFYIALRYTGKGIVKLLKMLWMITDRFRKWLMTWLKRFGLFICRPFISLIRYIMLSVREAKAEKKKIQKKSGILSSVSFIGKLLFGKKGIAVLIFNFIIPAISVFFLFSVITYASSINYAVKLTVNGKFLGYIENEQVFLDAKEVLQDRINYLGGNVDIEAVPSYSVEQIGYGDTLTKYQITDLILQNSGVSLDYGYGFYINDVFYGALMDFSKVKTTLESLLEKYETDNDSEQINFVDNIRYDEAGLYLTESIIDEDWLIGVLTGTKKMPTYYTTVEGDSHIGIANKTGLSTEELERLNPGFSENDIHIGEHIKTGEEVPFLSISTTRTEVYTIENVPYDTETVDDPNIYVGFSREKQKGQYGENRVTANVTYVNGIETGREITQVVSVVKPVTEIIAIGSKPTPAGTFIEGTAAYGKIMYPFKQGMGEISQWAHWDGGYSGHKGIDIAGIPYGEPVYAGASGIVTDVVFSQYGLGNHIVIYHEELGISTVYGHNSSIFVKEGQRISQGECIAGAGSTGWSTGIHVHFGVMVNGVSVNPRNYLDIPSWVPIHLV